MDPIGRKIIIKAKYIPAMGIVGGEKRIHGRNGSKGKPFRILRDMFCLGKGIASAQIAVGMIRCLGIGPGAASRIIVTCAPFLLKRVAFYEKKLLAQQTVPILQPHTNHGPPVGNKGIAKLGGGVPICSGFLLSPSGKTLRQAEGKMYSRFRGIAGNEQTVINGNIRIIQIREAELIPRIYFFGRGTPTEACPYCDRNK